MCCLVYESIIYLEEAQVRCQYSAAGLQSPCAYGLNLNPLGSSLSSAGSLTAQDTQKKTVSLPTTS